MLTLEAIRSGFVTLKLHVNYAIACFIYTSTHAYPRRSHSSHQAIHAKISHTFPHTFFASRITINFRHILTHFFTHLLCKRTAMKFRKHVVAAAIKSISELRRAEQHRPFDIWALVLIRSLGDAKKQTVNTRAHTHDIRPHIRCMGTFAYTHVLIHTLHSCMCPTYQRLFSYVRWETPKSE